ncbi:MAG TPA: TonB-dependent receptor [Ignavibacteriaceae bacterium]|nr:TonB-dependent receptor [Ignavibacteriaceae bacterium]
MNRWLMIMFLLMGIQINSQQSGLIMGKVTDATTKQPIPGVNVFLLGTTFGAATDDKGEYSIRNIPVGSYQLRASAIGYDPTVKTDVIINAARPAMIDFQLKESIIELGSVEVTADYFTKVPTEVNSIKTFNYEEIRRAPGGFEDVVRALSVLPGVAQAEAGRNDLVVRGGAPSENLFIVDGFPVQNINHFGSQGASGGPLSYVNLDFVRETSFSTGGFSALYGDKLSSVLTIDLRDGRKDKFGGKATISATQFGLNAEGPLSDKSNFLFSARRSYLDFIFKAAGFGFVPEYYDLLTKINYNFDNNNSLSFLLIGAFDNVKFFNDTEEKRYKNSRALASDQTQYITGLSFRHLFNKGFYTISLSRNYIDYDTVQRDSLLNPVFMNVSKEEENTLRGDLVYKISPKAEVNVGASIKLIQFEASVKLPFFITTFGETLNVTALNSGENFWKSDAYFQYSGFYFNRLRMNLGIRTDYFNAISQKYSFSPRLSLAYLLTDITTLNFSTGIYHQSPSYIWLISDATNRELKKIRVDQYILGIDHRLRNDVNLRVESYYKDYKNYPASITRPYIVLANTGAGYTGAEDNFASFGLEPLVSEGKGFSRGVELSVQKKSSRISHYGLFSLTYNETFFTPLDGIKRPGAYEQKWILNLSVGYIFNEKWEASFKFRYATGKPYTPFNPDGTQSLANYFSKRLPELHSLDVRVDRRWNFDGWTLITYIDIQNVYNRDNVSLYRWDARTKTVDEGSNIGILPSIGVSLEL